MNRLPRHTILVGDAHVHLRALPAASIDCVITSPPYWALRNYGMRAQLGLEASVHAWVAGLLPVFDELARVLKPEAALWLNVGDSYSRHHKHGAPAKSLVLAPERLALELVNRHWVLRNKVVWTKPNARPTSVGDRLACTWEYVFFFVRSRSYAFDLDAIRVPHRSAVRPQRSGQPSSGGRSSAADWAGPLAGDHSGLERLKAAGRPGHLLGKNPGDTWLMATSNFRGGHPATFPEALVERPLLATCPERVCVSCGLAWRRQQASRSLGHLAVLGELVPVCDCQSGWQPGIVLDPFMGSGTTAVVAERFGRDWVGVELNPTFAAMAEQRINAMRADPRKRAA